MKSGRNRRWGLFLFAAGCVSLIAPANTFFVEPASASISTISPSNLPASAPRATFSSMQNYPTSYTSWSEAGMTFTPGTNPGSLTTFGASQDVGKTLYNYGNNPLDVTFSQPANMISYYEDYNAGWIVSFYSDAASTHLVGSVTTAFSYPGGSTHAFSSSVPFQSVTFTSPTTYGDTFTIADFRFAAVPEPSTIALISVGAMAICLTRKRGQKSATR